MSCLAVIDSREIDVIPDIRHCHQYLRKASALGPAQRPRKNFPMLRLSASTVGSRTLL
jgi:hypothetical protein